MEKTNGIGKYGGLFGPSFFYPNTASFAPFRIIHDHKIKKTIKGEIGQMKNSYTKKLLSAGLAIAALTVYVPASAANTEAPALEDGETLFFDFGETPEYGWTTVTEKTKYNAERGYGFSMVSYVENEASSGSGVLSDAVKINDYGADGVSFNVDVPPGIYEISIYSGDIQYMTVGLEGHPAIIDLQYADSEGRVEIPVTDGQLNVTFLQGISGTHLSVAALSVTRKSGLEDRRKRVFICGDSTAATYYPLFVSQPLEEGYRGGWGQMLGTFLPDDIYVHNLASNGQTAKGFIEEGHLDSLLHFSEPGDYAVISFGYNDYLQYSSDEFTDHMTEILTAVKDKGCIPIVCSELAETDEFSADGTFTEKDNRFEAEAKSAAESCGAEYIDLHAAHAEYLTAIGRESAEKLFWLQWGGSRDTLHSSREGAGQAARIFAEECIENGIDEFSGKLLTGGLSGDTRLRCRVDGNDVYLVNTAPYELKLELVTNKYRSKKLNKTEVTEITLPAYDVLTPPAETAIYAPLYVRTNRCFLLGSGITIPLSDGAQNDDLNTDGSTQQ